MLIGRRRPEHRWLLLLCLLLAGSVAAARAARSAKARMAKATKSRPALKQPQGAHSRAAQENLAPRAARRRGTVTDEEGVRFEGWFDEAGDLHGRGTMHFPDGGWQQCTWVHGVPHGKGEYVGDDLSIIRGTWVDGDLEGRVCEYTHGGFHVYDGMYASSRRHGKGVLHFECGSRIEGDFVDGALNGSATWFYPDGVSGLKGVWRDGDMLEARYFGQLPSERPYPPYSKDQHVKWTDIKFHGDETTETHMGSHLLVPDPYETLVL
jgi:hypothetical protein